MKKYFLLAVVAVTLMTQVADAGLFSRWRSRRVGRTSRPVATAAAPAAATPAPAPAAAPTAPATK
jgi:hypothetical protein